MKRFTVTGNCIPGKHYMADTGGKVAKIMALVYEGLYFSINCPRQYGKTTTLGLLENALPDEYTVISISFEGADDSMFETAAGFCQKFLHKCKRTFDRQKHPDAELWKDDSVNDLELLSDFLTDVCRDKKYVLIIDEVDKSSNNTIFLKFLGILRDKYLARNAGKDDTFHSVILAGVYNIKNLKMKMVQAGTHQLQDGEVRINSPWNIAVDFEVDMSLSVEEIASMLADYERDHSTGMDIETVAQEIRAYTNGYPYLASRICMTIENKLDKDWTVSGITKAIAAMLREEGTTLIDDIYKNLNNNKDLNNLMFNIVALGKKYAYNSGIPVIELGRTFGFLGRQNDEVVIGNKFFETLLYRYFIAKLEIENDLSRPTAAAAAAIVSGGRLNMELLAGKFARHYFELYRKNTERFLERECRMLFLTYLQPIINGGGFYHVESETRDAQRTDVIVDYGAEQFIVELKIWRGETKHEEALDQIVGYLNSKNKDVGYLLTFDFRKNDNTGEPKMAWVEHGGKRIFDVMVGV